MRKGSLQLPLLIVSVFCGEGYELRASSICATVTDITGEPVGGAIVSAWGLDGSEGRYSAKTDSAGKICNDMVSDGSYSVEASGSGFIKASFNPGRVEFPREVTLSFRLPISTGGIEELLKPDATLVGVLMDGTKPFGMVRICLFKEKDVIQAACTTTNDAGQYEITVPLGKYRVELTYGQLKLHSTTIDFVRPGNYRNAVSIPSAR
jgi:hypothetical protein